MTHFDDLSLLDSNFNSNSTETSESPKSVSKAQWLFFEPSKRPCFSSLQNKMEMANKVASTVLKATNNNTVINIFLMGSFVALSVRSVNQQRHIEAMEAEKDSLTKSNKAMKKSMWDWKQKLYAEASTDSALVPLARLKAIYGEVPAPKISTLSILYFFLHMCIWLYISVYACFLALSLNPFIKGLWNLGSKGPLTVYMQRWVEFENGFEGDFSRAIREGQGLNTFSFHFFVRSRGFHFRSH